MNLKLLYGTAFFLLFAFQSFCQDLIIKKNGESIKGKVELIEEANIKYKKTSNLNGPLYLISKADVASIQFENGVIEDFKDYNSPSVLSKSEVQELIIKSINEHGFDADTFNRKHKASWEGDYLRLIVLHNDGKPVNNGLLYDFSNVYKFQKISKRSDKLAFINIFVSIAKNEKMTKWDKHKLVMRVDTPTNAETIVDALKKYNAILIQNPAVKEQ